MKRNFVSMIVIVAFVAMFSGTALAAEKAPGKVMELAKSTLADMGRDPVIVEAVKAENARGKTLAAIREMDEKWKTTPGIADFMQTMMDSKCGRYLIRIQDKNPYFAEIFVMDNQGANVCLTDKTSDYWQGDEAKFKNSFAGGKGAVFVDDVEFDDSTQSYISQVSVPVFDGNRAIGAITFGIDVDKL